MELPDLSNLRRRNYGTARPMQPATAYLPIWKTNQTYGDVTTELQD